MLVLPCVWWKLSEALDAQEALLGRAEHAVRLSVNTALKHKNQTLLYYPHLTKIKQTIIDGKHQLYINITSCYQRNFYRRVPPHSILTLLDSCLKIAKISFKGGI